MADFIAHNMAPIMFASLVVFLLLGYPVAFSLAACGLVFFIVGVEVAPLSHGTISLSWPLLQSLPERTPPDHEQRRSAGHSILHIDGVDTRTIRHG